jgi:hypothetical protein
MDIGGLARKVNERIGSWGLLLIVLFLASFASALFLRKRSDRGPRDWAIGNAWGPKRDACVVDDDCALTYVDDGQCCGGCSGEAAHSKAFVEAFNAVRLRECGAEPACPMLDCPAPEGPAMAARCVASQCSLRPAAPR